MVQNKTVHDLKSVWQERTRDFYTSPAFLLDINITKTKIALFRNLFPDIKLHYAVKSLNDEALIKGIASLVDGFDVASLGEIEQVIELTNKAKGIIYSNPVKLPEHIKGAYQRGVRHFAFDSVAEIRKLEIYAPGSSVYVRLKVDDHDSSFPLNSKFGVDLSGAVKLMNEAKSVGLKPEGITFHVGSQSNNPESWRVALRTADSLKRLLEAEGINIKYLNIGGGLPADYGNGTNINEIASVVNKGIKDYFSDVEIWAEPGRFLSAEAGAIVTRVIGSAVRDDQEWLFLDIGVFQGLMEPLELHGWKYPIFCANREAEKGATRKYVLTGPTCDAYDTISMETELPIGMDVGDTICIMCCGAYSIVYSSNFNGFEKPKTYYF